MDGLDKQIIRCIQAELPITKEPYKFIAEKLKMEEAELLSRIDVLLKDGIIRRIGAVLNHRNIGYQANAMVVWCIPEDKIEASAKQMVLQQEISHCYKRKSFPDWPYNVYTMIHAKTKAECDNIIRRVAETIEVYEYEVLYSTMELKKTSFIYFEEEEGSI